MLKLLVRPRPRAVQVADRWHLLRNLSEALKNALIRTIGCSHKQQEAARVEPRPLSQQLNLPFHPGSCAFSSLIGSAVSAATKRCGDWERREPLTLRSVGNLASITARCVSS